jgi:NADH-quinone oxidoreductase subunit C
VKPDEIHSLLAETHGDAIVRWEPAAKDPFVVVRADAIPAVMGFLRDDPRTWMDMLDCLSGVDLGERLGVVYHLFSFRHRHLFTVKVELPRGAPRVPSVALLWRGARWFEREAYDLIGIEFEGNPDLRRILCPEDWVGHPLRKDYVYPTHYAGIDNRREYE